MHLIIIGAGLSGLACAWWARRAGFDATVLDACTTVAEGASHVPHVLALPTALDPWFGSLPETPLGGWPWQRRRQAEHAEAARTERAQRLAQWRAAAASALAVLRAEDAADGETDAGANEGEAPREGVLYVFRREADWQLAQTLVGAWPDAGAAPRWLGGAECSGVEPALGEAADLLGGAWFEQAPFGNGAWLAKRLRHRLARQGARVWLQRRAERIALSRAGVTVEMSRAPAGAYDGAVAQGFVDPFARQHARDEAPTRVEGDCLVLAAGAGSLPLLQASGLAAPVLRHVWHGALTGEIGRLEHAPRRAVLDVARRVGIARLDRRLRIWGASEGESVTALERRVDAALGDAPGGVMRRQRAARWQHRALLGADGLPLVRALDPGQRIHLLLGGTTYGFALPFALAETVMEALAGRAAG